jgi:hypothetical protein
MSWRANKMSDIKTVTHEGQVYQLNKDYFFGNYKKTLKLMRIDIASAYPFKVYENGSENGYERIYLGSAEFGTITPAPIELIDGAAYMFNCDSDVDVIGLFSKGGGLFVKNNGAAFNACFCTNIRLMTVESK